MGGHLHSFITSMPEENPNLQGDTLTGESGTGKLSLLKRLSATHHNSQDALLDVTIPLVVIEYKGIPNSKDFVFALLSILSDHDLRHYQASIDTEILVGLFAKHRIRYQVVDEIHHLKTISTAFDVESNDDDSCH